MEQNYRSPDLDLPTGSGHGPLPSTGYEYFCQEGPSGECFQLEEEGDRGCNRYLISDDSSFNGPEISIGGGILEASPFVVGVPIGSPAYMVPTLPAYGFSEQAHSDLALELQRYQELAPPYDLADRGSEVQLVRHTPRANLVGDLEPQAYGNNLLTRVVGGSHEDEEGTVLSSRYKQLCYEPDDQHEAFLNFLRFSSVVHQPIKRNPATSTGTQVAGGFPRSSQSGILNFPIAATRDVERSGHNRPFPCWVPSDPRVDPRAMESLLMSANASASSEGQAEDAFLARMREDSTLQSHLGRAKPELEDPAKDLGLDSPRLVRPHHLDNAGIKEVKEGFKTEKQRRESMRGMYSDLRSLLPASKSTKMDRASIVEDTIQYIQVLGNQIEELQLAVDLKRSRRQGKKLVPGGQKPKQAVENPDKSKDGKELKFEKFKEFLSSEAQELHLVSKHGAVEFHMITDQLKVNVVQKHMPRFLLRLMEALAGMETKETFFNVIQDYDVVNITVMLEGKNLRKAAVEAMIRIFHAVEQVAA